ncbi:MAG: ABC transporter substrate-binding protein [Cyclobacteriaceae bacterium]|nr:ABC transporter substrate-binding protein [Cyclobacteriaceae bacterium]MCH8515318.1 ABC transporter substrate-binding protein [Cyclobacteriaceae bacterium]
MKRVKLLGYLFLTIFFAACGGENEDTTEYREASGGKYYGGVFRMNESEYIRSLYPHAIGDVYSYRIASQIYEGLFKFNDQDLSVSLSLAESYRIDSSNTVYTFKLKEGVYFHDDKCFPEGKGRELTSEDVKFSFTQLCTPGNMNQNFSTFQGLVVGADEYYEAARGGKKPDFDVKGIKIVDKYRVQIQLKKPNSIFPVTLAGAAGFIYPKEAFDMYGTDMRINTVGTGPFYLSDVEENTRMILKRNDNYHDTDEFDNELPFLDALSISFIGDKKSELFEFKKGNLDMIYRLPTEFIIEILEGTLSDTNGEYRNYELQRSPEMVTQMINFNTSSSIFADKNLRKAISFAIDREKILNFVLNGEGYAPGHHGITPPVFSNYDISEIQGVSHNVDSAQYYLQRSAYGTGKKALPKIEFLLNAEGERNTQVAVEIQKQVKDAIDIDLEINILPFSQVLEQAYKGNYSMMKVAWFADFPSPENFLWLYYGKDVPKSKEEISYPNVARYVNPNFDRLYEMALNASTINEANLYFLEAEKELMRDHPVAVLWYDEGYRLVQNYIMDFPNNPMQYRDFSEVYFKKSKKLN